MEKDLQTRIDAVQEDIIRWRRHIHQNPELAFNEKNTAAYIMEQLSGLPHVTVTQLSPTSVQAYIKGAKPGKKIALRADIDALPVPEESGEPFTSCIPGVSHACGHDAHAAMLMGAVKVLSQVQERIAGEVVCIFQHAEELPPGGALELVQKGVLDGVDMIFCMHVRPEDPVGVLRYINGVFCASMDNFDITIKGRSAHGAMPQVAIDPIVAGSQVVCALQTVISRRIEPSKSLVITVSTFTANGGYNTIPDTARLAGTVRTHDKLVRGQLREFMEQTVAGVCAMTGAGYEIKWIDGYPVGVNDDQASSVALAAIRENLPEMKLTELPALFSGEDFAYYAEKIPACSLFIGSGNGTDKTVAGLHNSKFKVDERVLGLGVGVHVGLIRHLLME